MGGGEIARQPFRGAESGQRPTLGHVRRHPALDELGCSVRGAVSL